MHFLRALKVGKRLAAGFGLSLALMVVLMSTVMYSNQQKSKQFHDLLNDKVYKIIWLEKLLDLGSDVTSLRRLILILRDDKAAVAGHERKIQDLNTEYNAIWADIEPRVGNGPARAMLGKIAAANEAITPVSQKFSSALAQEKYDLATTTLLQEILPLTTAWQDEVIALIEYQKARATKSQDEFEAIERAANVELWVLGILSILMGSIAAILITRSLTSPLAQAMRVADAMSEGDFDEKIDTSHKDEVNDLLHSMRNMRERVREVICAQREMARRHNDDGQVSYRMDEARFPGEYGDMVRATNGLINAHVTEMLGVIEIMGEYAVGNLGRDVNVYPGEKSVLTHTMRQVKDNLGAINAEIKRLAGAAANGDFSQRGEIAKFQHDFREMLASLNAMMESTNQNVEHISGVLQAIAEGDLTHRMHGDFKGVFAKMRDDANRSAEQLANMIVGIQQASGAINMAAGEIASGNHDLSRRTEQQAANLEETAASMEELTTTVRNNAEHAGEANQLSLSAANVAQQGGNVVGQVVATMSEIEASSKKIADIITVIDGIAFQTNILALNAAVEAARAGEQGRGFAVVATEVRSLAQRSATAAREIKGLIEDSTSKVSEGAQLAEDAGRTMDEIVASVKQVTEIMTEISGASQEQASGIEQVNQTIMQMDETTQKNAALVEEAAASAGSMEQQASALAQAVARFKIEGSTGFQPAAPVAAKAATLSGRSAPPVSLRSTARPLRGSIRAAAAIGDSDDGNWQEF